MTISQIKHIQTSQLIINYEETGPDNGIPVILLHGFPDDVRAWDGVVAELIKKGYRTIVPYLRGYGKTQFLNANIMRSGQQAALGNDLFELINNLKIEKAMLVGFDWGSRAACIVAALWPERVLGLVSIGGYNIQNISELKKPTAPEKESLFWYFWYFNTARGRLGLESNKKALCRLLWQQWSPHPIDDKIYEQTAISFDNSDFTDVVVHSYQHRLGATSGDPCLEAIEKQLASQPLISVPTISMDGAKDGLFIPGEELPDDSKCFSNFYKRRIIADAGHLLPRDAPLAVIQAIDDLKKFNQRKNHAN